MFILAAQVVASAQQAATAAQQAGNFYFQLIKILIIINFKSSKCFFCCSKSRYSFKLIKNAKFNVFIQIALKT